MTAWNWTCDYVVAQGKLNHDRLGASGPDRRQPVKAGAAFRAPASRLRP